jgi:hypothetical protein
MSSTESSGAPAEATATPPASNAEATFGSTRGSGLARGKAKRQAAPAAATAASSDYTPTAIAVVTAPREYQNPFAPVETPAAVTSEPALSAVASAKAEPVAHVPEKAYVPPAHSRVIEEVAEEAPAPVESHETDEHAELNILPPEQPRNAPAQTWESEGFRPAREPRGDRPRREESRRDEPRPERAPRQEIPTPEKFLYVRPGYNYVPTPSNYGGAPRENRVSRPAATESYSAAGAATPAKAGGFFGWLKSLFGGTSAPAPAAAQSGEHRSGDRSHGDRHRGGRGRSHGGGDGQRRRSRGGRGRNSQRGEFHHGGDQGGPSAT